MQRRRGEQTIVAAVCTARSHIFSHTAERDKSARSTKRSSRASPRKIHIASRCHRRNDTTAVPEVCSCRISALFAHLLHPKSNQTIQHSGGQSGGEERSGVCVFQGKTDLSWLVMDAVRFHPNLAALSLFLAYGGVAHVEATLFALTYIRARA